MFCVALRFYTWCLFYLAMICMTSPLSGKEPMEGSGVVIESFSTESTLAQAGVLEGDVFYRWELVPDPSIGLEAEKGEFGTPFDWMLMIIEQAPKGFVCLKGERSGYPLTLMIPRGVWTSQVRPLFNDDAEELYQNGRSLMNKGQIKQGVSFLKKLSRDPWVDFTIGKFLVSRRHYDEASFYFESALSSASIEPDVRVLIEVQLALLKEVELDYEEAIDIYSCALLSLDDDRQLLKAKIMNELGFVLDYTMRFDEAGFFHELSLGIRSTEAPGSMQSAVSFAHLGSLKKEMGNISFARELLENAVGIVLEYPGSERYQASYMNNLGNIELDHGSLHDARRWYDACLDIANLFYPESNIVATALNNVGLVNLDLGLIEEAEEVLLRAVDLKKRNQASPESIGASLNSLGMVYYEQGAYEKSKMKLMESKSLKETLGGNLMSLGKTLVNLGAVCYQKGLLQESACYYYEAKSVFENVPGENLHYAFCLGNLANIETELGNLETALVLMYQALDLLQNISPNSISYAFCLRRMGDAYFMQGEFGEAIRLYEKAIRVYQKNESSVVFLAYAINSLGRAMQIIGEHQGAVECFLDAVGVYESQLKNIGVDQEILLGFRSRNYLFYKDLEGAYHSLGRYREAFDVLERYRNRTLLEKLVRRDFQREEIKRSKSYDEKLMKLDFEYERETVKLFGSNLNSNEKKVVRERLLELNIKKNKLVLFETKARFAKLDISPLGLDDIVNVLSPGTLMVSYSVFDDVLVAYLLRYGKGLKRIEIPVDKDALSWEIMSLLDKRFINHSVAFLSDFQKNSQELYDMLIKPFESEIEMSNRLIVIPDGPLKKLPFGLLFNRQESEYLIEQIPITTAVSGTLFAQEIRQSSVKPSRIAIVGDPVYPLELKGSPDQIANLHGTTDRRSSNITAHQVEMSQELFDSKMDFSVRSRMKRAGHWQRLPQTGYEVDRIAELFGDKVITAKRDRATEDFLKTLPHDIDILHIAAHAYTDNHRALDSGLVLTINNDFQEGEENGILHAWEIIEDMRLDADLVVLSACETGLGEDAAGEGLIGLTHAFQLAGARSIIASYWNVEDVSTAILMERFYTYLKAGHTKDVALQKAQIDLIHNPIEVKNNSLLGRLLPGEKRDVSHPYFWAGFQLIGPWN